MKKSIISLLVTTTLTLLSINNNALACTDFRVTAQDGSVVITRSMEFSQPADSHLNSSPRGRSFETVAADGQPGLSWKSKYGYVYLDGFGIDTAVDGMNEQGLSFEALYMPGYAQYQTVPNGSDKQALPYPNFGEWILGNFKTIDEVRQALTNVFVYTQKIPGQGNMVYPLHFSIYDSTGKGIVVEYVDGKLNIYDNKVGVLTNSPSYDWHVTNLNNYTNLKPINPVPVMAKDGVVYAATGQGYGMIGLPGDISPPSRFVKTAVLLATVLPVPNAKEAVNLAQHIINNVDIPRGLAREKLTDNVVNETTEWVVFKDLTHKMFYYRTYDDMTLRVVSLADVNFAENAPRLKMAIDTGPYVQNITNKFLGSKTG